MDLGSKLVLNNQHQNEQVMTQAPSKVSKCKLLTESYICVHKYMLPSLIWEC